MLTPLSYFIAVTGVAECVATTLEEHVPDGTAGRPERVVFAPGAEVPWDGGRDCSQLGFVIEHGPFPSVNFPVEQIEDSQAGCVVGPTAVRVVMSLIRCTYHPAPTNQGKTPPTAAQQIAAARLQCVEEYYVRQAITCCLAQQTSSGLIDDYRIGSSDRQVNGDMGEISVRFSMQIV